MYKYTQAYQVPKKGGDEEEKKETERERAHTLLLGMTDMHSNNVLLLQKRSCHKMMR